MKTVKVLSVCLCVLLALLAFTGCQKQEPFPENMDGEKAKDLTLQILDNLHAGEYETVNNYFREDLRPENVQETWGPVADVFEKTGPFVEYSKVELSGQTGQDGIEYACVTVTCKYQNGQHIWAAAFDPEYNLISLYIVG